MHYVTRSDMTISMCKQLGQTVWQEKRMIKLVNTEFTRSVKLRLP